VGRLGLVAQVELGFMVGVDRRLYPRATKYIMHLENQLLPKHTFLNTHINMPPLLFHYSNGFSR